jgi:hypothetical protein
MPRALALLASALVAGCSAGEALQRGGGGDSSAQGAEASPTARDRAIVRKLVAFARSPSESTWSEVPFADRVALGLGPRLVETRPASELVDPRAWRLDARDFRGYVGPFSALELLAENRRLEVSVGPHPHCVSPPVRPPRQVAYLRRLAAAPPPESGTSCLQWFTVDAFVTADGRIAAVTLDAWEP